MNAGEVANVYCPQELDNGGIRNLYTDFGNEWVHQFTDMNYILEVNWCDTTYKDPKPSRIMGPIEDKRCVYLVAE